ncbi:MAG: alpha/beta hydrolase family protein [Vicinamibacterales bacterium]
MSTLTRRRFCQSLGASGWLLSASFPLTDVGGTQTPTKAPDNPHIGNLYPFVQQQADRSRLELSFLQPQFRDLASWQRTARARVLEHLFYSPAAVSPEPEVIRRSDRGDYIEEYLTFRTTPDLRVPAYLLIPKAATRPAPGVVLLHCHGGAYVWGKEKVVAVENEHPVLSQFKQQLYEGTSIATELVRRGYVVITIDMFYWGERRMLLEEDPASYRERERMSADEIAAFNRRSSQSEQLVARSLMTAGITWPGVMLWDDLRTLDYLAGRPEVDRQRLGCVGLSVGGYRSFLLAALDQRIKAAVDVGWMTSFASNIRRHVLNTVGLTFHIPGLYRYLDLPDLAALIAPRSVFVINGSKDGLFPRDGVDKAFRKIEACFQKAGVPEHQRCRLYEAPHQFNREMQAEAWEWLGRRV